MISIDAAESLTEHISWFIAMGAFLALHLHFLGFCYVGIIKYWKRWS